MLELTVRSFPFSARRNKSVWLGGQDLQQNVCTSISSGHIALQASQHYGISVTTGILKVSMYLQRYIQGLFITIPVPVNESEMAER